ncbi:MAG: hypothetical protein GEU96_04365 [Propionibacteriales bacterium]|nr:hypothetical protein [Propionibacteriales bacterium]
MRPGGIEPGAYAMDPLRRPPPTGATGQSLDGFLSASGVEVLDVRRGAAAGTRRLLVGDPIAASATYAVAVADQPISAPAVDAEARLLGDLQALLPAELVPTVPRVVGPVDVRGRVGLVVTAVPGLLPEQHRLPSQRRQPAHGRSSLQAVREWLARLWHTTGGVAGSIDLGRDAADQLFARYAGSAQLAPSLGAAHRARSRIGRFETARTVTHGCLCPDHVHVDETAVIGVDDWALGSVSSEPLRDLGGFAVRTAGERLPEVVVGRTAYAHVIRDFVISGLAEISLPKHSWRDVLVLTQLERASAELDAGNVGDIDLLARTVRALPRERGYEETRTT